MTLLIVLGVIVTVAIGIGIGWLRRWRMESRQLDIITERLAAEQRIDAITRATLAAMRSLVRQRSQ
jgi:hypothetical protein